MYGLDLFSGIGGLTEALADWVTPIAYCEYDKYVRTVLLSRMLERKIPVAPIWDDVRTLKSNFIRHPIDIIYGGFPCQDISAAGRGTGLDGERSGLYWQLHRLVIECRPTFVFLENVPAIRTRGLVDVVRSFADVGYDCRWTRISAASVGANHIRERWFLLAHTNGIAGRHESRRRIGESRENQTVIGHDGAREHVADTESVGCREGRTEINSRERNIVVTGSGAEMANAERARLLPATFRRIHRQEKSTGSRNVESGGFGWWSVEPDVGRVANGVQFRVDRIKSLGNAVVPQQAKEAFQILMGMENG